jgi:5-methylcytosine-specific restriction endonuclease McrA
VSWAKFDDRYDDNRKVKRAWKRSGAAAALHVMAITYCCRHQTDGVVDLAWIEEKLPSPREREKVIGVLVDVGLFNVLDGETFEVNDFLEYNPSKAQVEREREWDRRRKELHRDPELVAAIRKRDQDRCRYCGVLVNWKDRRGQGGATYDHIVPRGANSFENVVVACRYCNYAKNNRTPEQAGMRLLSPGEIGNQNGPRSELGPNRVRSSSGLDVDLTPAGSPSRPVPSRNV